MLSRSNVKFGESNIDHQRIFLWNKIYIFVFQSSLFLNAYPFHFHSYCIFLFLSFFTYNEYMNGFKKSFPLELPGGKRPISFYYENDTLLGTFLWDSSAHTRQFPRTTITQIASWVTASFSCLLTCLN